MHRDAAADRGNGRLIRAAVAVLGLLASAGGCRYTELAAGQLQLINEQRPLAPALARERDPMRRALLALAPEVVAFGRDVMQLRPGRSYTGYFATERSGIVYVVSASERTRLVPYLFAFPIVGEVAYQSFFDERDARAAAAELEAAGYDAYVGPATAYSTLGYLRDPVTSVMMRKGRAAFIEVLLHEMTHGRLYVPGDSEFSEQLASFVAERGLEQYVALHHAADLALQEELRSHLARRRAAEAELRRALAEVEALYASPLPPGEKLRRRKPLFATLSLRLRRIRPDATQDELIINNARLLQYARYVASAPELRELWRTTRGNWVRFWSAVEDRAR